jgi:DNA-binding transcriptional ArsR family regulator
MGVWLLDADTLARSRFVISPLAETVNALRLLAARDPWPWERAWLSRHHGKFRQRVSASRFSAALADLVLAGPWQPVTLGVPPQAAIGDFDLELARLRHTPTSVLRDDLAWCAGGSLPADLDVADPADEIADLIQWTWDHTLQAEWPRRHRHYQADITARTAIMSQQGWGAAISTLIPPVRWLGDGRLQVSTRDRPPRDLRGADLLFIPGAVRAGRVTWDPPASYAIVYPAAGLLADPAARTASPALGRLLGPNRAGILLLLDRPVTTTQLAAITGLALGTVGAHLRVLLDAHLIDRSRAGAAVLYYRTATGQKLIDDNLLADRN